MRLGVNIDHVATLRNARGGVHPDPLRAAHLAIEGGADGITAHLREDRRHISDTDISRLKNELTRPLNLEMAATEEMLRIATRHVPNACCLVPERREERTTEGGLDVQGSVKTLKPFVAKLQDAGIRVSLFIEPDLKTIEAAAAVGTDISSTGVMISPNAGKPRASAPPDGAPIVGSNAHERPGEFCAMLQMPRGLLP